MGSTLRLRHQITAVYINSPIMCTLPPSPAALEASPQVVEKLLEGLGVAGVKAHDLLSTEDEALASLPGRMLGLLLTLPKEAVPELKGFTKEDLYIIEQDSKTTLFGKFIGKNMLGTIALIHVIANTMTESEIGSGLLGKFIDKTRTGAAPSYRGEDLATEYPIIIKHNEAADEGHSLPIEGEARHNIVAFAKGPEDVPMELTPAGAFEPGRRGDVIYMIDGQTGTAFVLEGPVLAAVRGYMSGGESVDYSLLAVMRDD